MSETRPHLLTLDTARWRLTLVWFPACGLIFLLLVVQSLGGVYGSELQRVWGWALPNFLPTLALIVSVFAAEALKPYETNQTFVRANFCRLSIGLSIFYLVAFSLSILTQPFLQILRGPTSDGISMKIDVLETSNIWLGPLQGLVVVSLGVLFFLKEGEKKVS
jgi:hypothetical protein